MVVYLHACVAEELEQPPLPQPALAYVVTAFPQAIVEPLSGWFAVYE